MVSGGLGLHRRGHHGVVRLLRRGRSAAHPLVRVRVRARDRDRDRARVRVRARARVRARPEIASRCLRSPWPRTALVWARHLRE